MSENNMIAYELPPKITVHVINDILVNMNELTHENSGQFVFDASAVETIDATGLQLIISAFKTINKDKNELILINPSVYLKEILFLSGADHVLKIKEGE